METNTLDPVDPASAVPAPVAAVGSAPGLKPTPDPTRSGALWVGGAGVALLLAAAAVLTAVRWDDIGQSMKLGGLVAITLALLAGGRRARTAIPMTAQAVFHLGALLIPFDMAAVAILAGRSWQETLLLTSVTSVAAWYGIHRAEPSPVLLWCARGGVVAVAAGLAAVGPVAMPLALAVMAAVAIGVRCHLAGTVWAVVAGFLPLASLVDWPPRIAGSMADLGFAAIGPWQPLAAGVLAMTVLVVATASLRRLEVAWSAVAIGVVTVVVALARFDDAATGYLTVASLFLAIEMLMLVASRDTLWKPVLRLVGPAAELIALCTTSLLLAGAAFAHLSGELVAEPALAAAAAVLGLGWLTADRGRLDEATDWLTGLLVGSDWPLTTVMVPASVLGAVLWADAPPLVAAAALLVTGYWMVATWRLGAAYGAVLLGWLAALFASELSHWPQMGIGVAAAAMLVVATRLGLRRTDPLAPIVAALGAVLVWLTATEAAYFAFDNRWPILLIVLGTWLISTGTEASSRPRAGAVADWVGRLGAVVVVLASFTLVQDWLATALCLLLVVLAAVDFTVAAQRGVARSSPRLQGLAVLGGAALGLAGVPLSALIGLETAEAGVALAIAAFVAVGLALALPQALGLSLGSTAAVTAVAGLALSAGEPGMFAYSIIAVGSAVALVGAALRDPVAGAVGFVTVGLGVALRLAAWEVDWLEPYLVFPAIAALVVGHRHHRSGGSSWAAYVPTIGVLAYVALADRLVGGSAWHSVIAGAIGVVAIIAGGYRRLAGPLIAGSVVLAAVVGYESLGPAALVPTWAWLAAGGTILLAAGIAMERTDTSPLERGRQLRDVITTQFS